MKQCWKLGALFFLRKLLEVHVILHVYVCREIKKKLISEIYLDIVNHDVYCNTFQESAFQGNIVNVLFSFTKKKRKKKSTRLIVYNMFLLYQNIWFEWIK